MHMKNNRSNFRFWLLVWGLGIIGQLCWNIENQWFNTFVYAKIAKDPTIISWMVAVSAIATTVSTFLFGTMSDRSGRRKPFMAVGYISSSMIPGTKTSSPSHTASTSTSRPRI